MGSLFLIAGCGGGGGSLFGGDTTESLSGYIRYGGVGVEGVTVTISGPETRTTTTDANGYYVFGNVDAGEYTVTPSDNRASVKFTFRFAPFKRTAYMSDVEATGFDFNAITPQRLSSSTHTLFVKDDGTVWAWGRNESGQLGIGSADANPHQTPVQIGALVFNDTLDGNKAVAVAAGSNFSLVLRKDGSVWAWGDNTYGQLGTGNNTSQTTPVETLLTSGVIAISAGYGHAIAAKSDGTVWTWGYNATYQLGDGTTTANNTPTQIGASVFYNSTDYKAVSVSAGYNHTLALRADGYVYGWGSNDRGQLSSDPTADSPVLYEASPTAISANKVEVAAGHQFSVVIHYSPGADGLVYTCGRGPNNDAHQIGRSIAEDSYAYSWGALNLQDAATISAGYDHVTLVKKDGTVWAWGDNASGQLGNGDATGAAQLLPIQIATAVNITRIAAGTYDTIALGYNGSADTMFVWGYNAYGQLGDGGTSDRTSPYQLTLP